MWWMRKKERDLARELRGHLELEAEDRRAGGAGTESAHFAARRALGNVTAIQEEVRAAWGWTWLERLAQDLRFAARMLRKDRGFTATAVLTLALGIGANTAIFSLVRTVLFRALPFRDADRLVVVWEDNSHAGFPRDTPAPANFADWKAQNRVFEDMAAEIWQTFNLTGDGDPERVTGLRVTGNFFAVLGVKPAGGRMLLPEDDTPEANQVAVVGYALWQRRYGGARSLVGRTIMVDDEKRTVVGIAPPGFEFPSKGTELWVPAALTPRDMAQRTSHYLTVVGRLKPGTSLARAQGDMTAIARKLEQDHPDSNKYLGAVVVPMREQFVGDLRPALNILLATVGAILLIACANVAHLLLARGSARSREMAVRAALGAGRTRVIWQLLTESLVLGGLGALAGAALSTATFRFLGRLIPDAFPEGTHLGLDLPVLEFTAGIALLTSLLFGAGPAFSATRFDVNRALKSRTGKGGRRTRSALVVAEMTLTLVMLVSAGLLLGSYSRIRGVDVGFHPENLLIVETPLAPSKYGAQARRTQFYRDVLERVSAQPGVVSAGYVNFPPLTLRGGAHLFRIEGRPEPRPGQVPAQIATNRTASTGYLRTMGIPLLRGRYFDEHDGPEAPLVIDINQTMARTFWPNQDAVGKRIQFGRAGTIQPWYTIIGVVGDVRQMGLDVPTRAEMYFPLAQVGPGGSFFWPRDLVVRTAGDPLRAVSDVRRAVAAVDREQAVFTGRTMEDILDGEVSNRHTQMILLVAFALLALALAAVGLYGLLAYAVAQATPEIGLRMALGAQRGRVVGGIVGRGLALAICGVGAGLAVSWAMTRAIASLLFHTSPRDPVTFAAGALVLLAVAAAASFVPARRAASIDPAGALRHE